MRKSALYTFVFLCLFGKLNSQNFTPNQTYSYTRVFLDSVSIGSSNYPTAQSTQVVQYTDGWGRPSQTISINSVKPGQDIVTSYFYEPSGIQTKKYMPVAASSKGGIIHDIDEAGVNSYHGVPNAYDEVTYDGSPQMRIVKSASPGIEWGMASGNVKEYSYEFNEPNSVKRYTATLDIATFQNSLTDGGYYTANTLYKNSVKDEDGNVASVYKNGLGQTILSRVKNGTYDLDTYYVYNQYGQLSYIVPPLNPGEVATDDVVRSKVLYQYQYDAYGRLTEKKTPGKSWEYYVYDRENRIVMSTDEKLKAEGKWTFIKYDGQGRTIYTGLCSGTDRAAMQQGADNSTVIHEMRTPPNSPGFSSVGFNVYYTKNAYPTSVTEVLSINYYDEYPAGITVTKPVDIYSQPTLSSDNAENHSTKSLLTASFVRNIGNTGWNRTLFWYDTKERLVGNHKISYLNGTTKTEMKLDFPGNITESKVYHARNASSANVVVKQRYVYSQQNLLLRHYHQVDSQPEELLEELAYDDLGRVTNKKVGNSLQSIDYQYNIRGWLTAVNDQDNLGTDLFAFKINFNQRNGVESPNNDNPQLKVKPRFNGSISETSWATTPGFVSRYGYVYDPSGRMLAGLYQHPYNPYQKDHSEIASYDNRGNVKTLFRTAYKPLKGSVRVVDNLDYNTYDGNSVTRIADLSGNASGYEGGNGTIQYDANGNMTSMLDKGITEIAYNFLNLPVSITDKNVTTFLYGADGTKLRKNVRVNNKGTYVNIVTEYMDGFQYSTPNTAAISKLFEEPAEGSGAEVAKNASEPEAFFSEERAVVAPIDGESVMELVFFPTSEGYYDYKNKRYIYQYRDHLGNVRMSYTSNGNGGATVLDTNNYYAFGMNHLDPMGDISMYDPLSVPYNYKYNGKELQETGMYDYGWRMYMPDIARWNGIDQLAESYISHSTYAYVMNNPIMMYDPDGRYGDMPDWLKTMWHMTAGGTNTSWTNTGTGSGFMNTGFSGSMTPSYMGFYSPLGSTVGYNGTGIYAFGNSGGLGGNSGNFGGNSGFNDNLPLINIPEVFVKGNSSGWGKQAQAHFNAFMAVINENEAAFAKWDKINKGIGGFGFANGVKTTMIEQAGKYSTLTKTTSNYLKFFKGAGIAGSAVTTAYSGYKVYGQYQQGGVNEVFQHKDIFDATVGGVGLVATGAVYFGLMSNPVGWAIGAGVLIYGAGTLIFDNYNP